ncbi:MAG TPA: hypothetical protein VFB12_02805 [Ktedonobacteraceae bacterium]|nr:hypothetical protein [Ktedonobacteraceae bacterium]
MAQPEQSIVVGVFEDRTTAGQAIKSLRQAGFHDEQLGFAARHEAFSDAHKTATGPNAVLRGLVGGLIGAVDTLLLATIGPADASSILSTALPVTEEIIDRLPFPGSHTRPTPSQETSESRNQSDQDTTEQEQAHDSEERISIVTGGATGGILGGFAGAAASLLIPGIGPAVAGGILVSVLSSAALGGVAGGFLGAFTRMGIPEEQARYYEREFKAGRTIVTVQTTDHQQEAMDMLHQHGAYHVQAY